MHYTISAILTAVLVAFIALFTMVQLIQPVAQACDPATPSSIQSGIIIHDAVPCAD